MDLTGQIIQLLSEPPGSFVYHIITLFALQVVFAISYTRWRRCPEDDYARNMSWAAAAIFLGRLALLLAGLYYGRDPAAAAGILPPLEQAINTASILLLVWALIPAPEQHPRLLDILLVTGLILTAVMYIFFAQEWQAAIAGGETAFHGTMQATIWSLVEIAILAAGLLYLVFKGRALGALPPIILSVLLLFHIIHLWNYPEFIPTNTNVAYWIRLGNLIAIPLWAVFAYLYAMTPLLESESKLQESVDKFGVSLAQAAQVIATPQPQHRLAYSLQLTNKLFDTSFSAIGLLDADDAQRIVFYYLLSNRGPGEIQEWQVNLADQAALAAALKQSGSTVLYRDGLGSRQLYAFFDASDLEPAKTLLFYPLTSNGQAIGLLVLPLPGNGDHLIDEKVSLVPGVAQFVAQALTNSQTPPRTTGPEPEPPLQPVMASVPAAIVMDRARLQDLEHDLDQARADLQEAEQKRRHAEANAAAAQKQARYLAAALRAVQAAPNEYLQTADGGETGQQIREQEADVSSDSAA